jgi:hypothetical protein
VHFLMHGGTIRECRQPHALFHPRFYAQQLNRQIGSNENLLVDYLLNWRENGARPYPLFDPEFYLGEEGWSVADENPLVDYVLKGRTAEGAPHPLFDSAWYTKSVSLSDSWVRTQLEHYCSNCRRTAVVPASRGGRRLRDRAHAAPGGANE